MTEELKALKKKVDSMMEEAGIPDITPESMKEDCSRFAYPEIYERRKHPQYSFYEVFGFDINVEQVFRRNATEQNTSLRIEINEWSHSSGHTVESVKIGIHDSDKKITRLVSQIIASYKGIRKDTCND